MTMYYTPKEERALQHIHQDHAIEDAIGRKPESAEERERIWKLLSDVARS